VSDRSPKGQCSWSGCDDDRQVDVDSLLGLPRKTQAAAPALGNRRTTLANFVRTTRLTASVASPCLVPGYPLPDAVPLMGDAA